MSGETFKQRDSVDCYEFMVIRIRCQNNRDIIESQFARGMVWNIDLVSKQQQASSSIEQNVSKQSQQIKSKSPRRARQQKNNMYHHLQSCKTMRMKTLVKLRKAKHIPRLVLHMKIVLSQAISNSLHSNFCILKSRCSP